MKKNLNCIFEPKSVAVIGASPNEGTVGNAILSNIIRSGFNGAVYAVNPKYDNIMSLRAYRDVMMVPEVIDLAIICVPAKTALSVIEQCAEKKIKGIVLITAGFKEIGEEGKKLEDDIVAAAKRSGIELIGPNCLGVVNTSESIKLNANFAFKMPNAGNIALISQSGAIGIVAVDYAHQQDLGISKFVSIGNKAVIDESDVLDYLIEDDETRIITMYVEDIHNPARFFESAGRAAAKQKPVIVIKTGTSMRGAMATHSHTGALSSSDKAYDALFLQCGVIRVTSLEELFECAKGFTCKAQPKGNRIAVVTNGGGMGIITTDASEKYHLEMATFAPATLSALKKALPPTASVNNPVDVIGDADAQRFSDALSVIVKDQNVDAVIVSVTPTVKTDMNAIASMLCDVAKANPHLPLMSNLLSFEGEPEFIQILSKADIPNFNFPDINVRVLATMIRYYQRIREPHAVIGEFEADKTVVQTTFYAHAKEKRNRLTEPESYAVLGAYGIKSILSKTAKTMDEATTAAEKIGYPVVLKIVSPDIMHKLDAGGVKINLENADQVKKAFEEISESVKAKKTGARIDGFLVEKMFCENGIETIVGAQSINGFGHLIMFGSGGTFVELFKDVSFRLAPLTRQDALDMIMETKGYQILKGYRGQISYDTEAIVDCLLRVSQMVTDFPMIQELDINPLKVLETGKGALVMDAKIIADTDWSRKDMAAAGGSTVPVAAIR